MKQVQRGFTLIELVMVIVILGVLAAVAIPKFADLSVDARNAAAQGVAGSLASATAINYAAKKVGNASGVALSTATSCTAAVLQPFVSGVTLIDGPAKASADGQFAVLAAPAGDCATALDGAAVPCSIQANGTGTAAQTAQIICAK